jgi:hypothetical protein
MGRRYPATIDPRSMSMPQVNATLPDTGIVNSPVTAWFSGRSRRMSSEGNTICWPQPSSDVRLMVRRTGLPGGALIDGGWYPVPSTVS